MECRVLKSGKCMVTQNYSNSHPAVDLVGENSTLDYIVAHTSGKVVLFQDGYDNIKGSRGNDSYGNFVKIDNGNGYATLYAHMKKGLSVKNGEYVNKGQIIGYMGDSGNAYGAHLHFEVWKDGVRVNSYNYLNSDLYGVNTKYKVGDIVNITGVYVSSSSDDRLVPLIKSGTITKIIEGAKNPYLLDNGNIGWVNDDVIVVDDNRYLYNSSYNGVSIVDALNEIGVDSSYSYRSKLASLNGIDNYKGSANDNTLLLDLLKRGRLKY